MFIRTALLSAAACLTLSACTNEVAKDTDVFWTNLQALCGQAYEGRLGSSDAADDDWRDERIVMHVRECSETEIRIPLHVGDDRSRTWVVTRDGKTLELRHDHRHEDGSEDAITQYGGFNTLSPTSTNQNFPADQATKDLFDAEGIPVSKDNVWILTLIKGHVFSYRLLRQDPDGTITRHFKLEFFTETPLETPPPPPWGSEE